MKLLDWYFKSNLLVRILLGLVLGAVCGLAFGPAMAWVTPFGEIFHPSAQNDRHAGHYFHIDRRRRQRFTRHSWGGWVSRPW